MKLFSLCNKLKHKIGPVNYAGLFSNVKTHIEESKWKSQDVLTSIDSAGN